jgi:hypothetical protein
MGARRHPEPPRPRPQRRPMFTPQSRLTHPRQQRNHARPSPLLYGGGMQRQQLYRRRNSQRRRQRQAVGGSSSASAMRTRSEKWLETTR